MKEIIYIQVGNTSNHIGTHFWNAQESYFTYGDDDHRNHHHVETKQGDVTMDHDVSFREGLSGASVNVIASRSSRLSSHFGPSRWGEGAAY